jgi:hypothetical protein
MLASGSSAAASRHPDELGCPSPESAGAAYQRSTSLSKVVQHGRPVLPVSYSYA